MNAKSENQEVRRLYYRAWREKNKERLREFESARYAARNKTEKRAYERAWYALNREKNQNVRLFKRARFRAKILGLPFTIVQSDIIIPEFCPALGIPLKKGKSIVSPGSPSVDRIIPSLGYVKGNVRVISLKANQIKSNATTEEIGQVYRYMLSVEAGG